MVNQKVAARLQVGPNCLLFFIDETGHETFADKNYPVFGLGGCAINSSSAAAVIAEPWRAMKAAHFGGEDVPLHANELRNPTTEQLDALSKFFREQQFARLAVTMSKSAVLPTGKTPLEIITGSMMNRYTDLLRRVSPEPNEVAFLHEASNRLAKTAARALRGDQFNSGLAMGLIAGAAVAAGILLFIKNSLSSLDTIGAGFVFALIGSVILIASVRSAK
jgi:uncharacterized membrane protein YeaQ/YmgE (transglycosylase-associated protein family)